LTAATSRIGQERRRGGRLTVDCVSKIVAMLSG